MNIAPVNHLNYYNNNYINNNNNRKIYFTGNDKKEQQKVFALGCLAAAGMATIPIGIGGCAVHVLYQQAQEAKASQYTNASTNTNDANTLICLPSDERTPEYYKIKKNDTLGNIVKYYAQLPDDCSKDMFEPYYEILEADNPGAWEDRDLIKTGTVIRIDGIYPENIQSKPADTPETDDPRYEKVEVNDMTFTFDVGTVSKRFLGGYEGRENGKFKTIDKTMSGSIIVTNYLGSSPEGGVKNEITYNKEGQIIEYGERDPKGERYWKYFVTYEYTDNRLIETLSPDGAISDFYRIITKYDREEDIVFLKEFLNDKEVVARFDFISGTAEIGEKTWTFDEGTFKYNETDDEIGYYSGTINGQSVIIRPSKSEISVQFLNTNNEVESELKFNTDGEEIIPEDKKSFWPWG